MPPTSIPAASMPLDMPAASTPATSMPAAGIPTAGMPVARMPIASIPTTSIPVAGIPATSVPTASMPPKPPAAPPHHRHLSRDERLQVRALRLAGHTLMEIASLLKISLRQAQYACQAESATPKKRSGRPGSLSPEQIQQLVTFVRASQANSRLSYQQLATGPFGSWQVTEHAIRNALRKSGLGKERARAKPPLPEGRPNQEK